MLINSFGRLNLTFGRRLLRPGAGRFTTTAQPSDPYYILGIERAAEFSEVKRVFYQLANEYHPDKNTSTVLSAPM